MLIGELIIIVIKVANNNIIFYSSGLGASQYARQQRRKINIFYKGAYYVY